MIIILRAFGVFLVGFVSVMMEAEVRISGSALLVMAVLLAGTVMVGMAAATIYLWQHVVHKHKEMPKSFPDVNLETRTRARNELAREQLRAHAHQVSVLATDAQRVLEAVDQTLADLPDPGVKL